MFKKTERLDIIFIILVTILAVTISYPFLLDTVPMFKDLVYSEYSTGSSINKEWELFLIRALLFVNVSFSSIYCYIKYKKNKSFYKNEKEIGRLVNISDDDYITFFLLCINLVYFVAKASFSTILLQLLILWIVGLVYNRKFNKEQLKYIKGKIVVLFFLVKLNVVAIFMLIQNLHYFGVLKSPYFNIDLETINVVSYVLYGLLLFLIYKRYPIDKIIVNAQFLLPLIFVYLLSNFYVLSGSAELLYQLPPFSYLLLACILLLFSLINNLLHRKKHYKSSSELEYKDIFSIATLCILAAYMCIDSGNSIFVSDLWHDGEQLVPYQQVNDFSKKLFVDYFPSSGLYSFFTGFFSDVFFDNNYFDLRYVYSFKKMIFILVITLLSSKVLGKFYTFFVLLVFFIDVGYDRTIFILPCFLLLSMKRIRKDELIWLSVWALCCLFSILYYPLYGAAISLGTLPIAINSCYKLFKKLKAKVKIDLLGPKIGIFALACLIVVYFLPLMFRELYNIYLFSSQTVNVDSISIVRPDDNAGFTNTLLSGHSNAFANYLSSVRLNRAAYQIMLMTVLIITPSLIYTYIPRAIVLFKNEEDHRRKETILNSIFSLIFIFVVIIVSYSYTLIRMDAGYFVNRSASIYVYCIGILFFYTMFKLLKVSKERNFIDILVFSILFITVLFSTGISAYSKEFNLTSTKSEITYFEEDFVHLEEKVDNLGNGFIKNSDLAQLEKYKAFIEEFDGTIWFYNSYQSYYYILNQEVNFASAGTAVAAKDIQELYFEKSIDRLADVIISDDLMLTNYYLTKTFIDYGYIYFVDESNNAFFMKEDYFNRHYSEEEQEKLTYSRRYDIQGKALLLWANSLEAITKETIKATDLSLKNVNEIKLNGITKEGELYLIHNSKGSSLDFVLDQSINGFDNDVIYLELEINDLDLDLANNSMQIFYRNSEKNYNEDMSVAFNANESLIQTDGNKYLIPMGVSPGWLAGEIDEIRVDFKGLAEGSTVKLKKLDFYAYPSYDLGQLEK